MNEFPVTKPSKKRKKKKKHLCRVYNSIHTCYTMFMITALLLQIIINDSNGTTLNSNINADTHMSAI